jgi:hypothetical protein
MIAITTRLQVVCPTAAINILIVLVGQRGKAKWKVRGRERE